MPTVTIDTDKLLDGLRQALQSSSMGSNRSTDDVTDALDGLEQTISKTSTQEAKQRAAEQKIQRDCQILFKNYNARLKQFADDFGVHSQTITNAYRDSVGKMEHEAYERLPDAVRNALSKTDNALMQAMAEQINSLRDVDITVDRIETLNSLYAAYTDGLIDGNTLQQRSAKILEEYGVHHLDATAAVSELAESSKAATDALADLAEDARGGVFTDLKDKMTSLAIVTGKVIAAYKIISEQFLNVAQPAMMYGTEVMDSYKAFRAGMNPEEFAAVQAQYRQQIGASGISLSQFQDTIMDGSEGLTAFTGSLKDSIRIQADSFATARRFGVEGEKATKRFILGQNALFRELNTVFSMTAEEFVAMNEQIKNSTAVQSRIYRLNRDQRQLYIEQYQQTVRQLKINGLQQEAAMAAADAMAQLGAESPKERLKKAAKLQAVGGALGFGGEATEAAQMLRTGDTANPRFAELMAGMQKRTGAVMGQGFGQEMMVSQMLETTGLGQVLGPESDFAKLNTQQYEKIEDLEKSAVKREEELGHITAGINKLNAFLIGPMAQHFATIAAGVTAILAFMGTKSALRNITDKGGIMEMLKNAGGAFGKIAGAGLVAAAVAGAATIGWQIGTMIYEALEKHFPNLLDTLGRWISKTLDFVGITDNEHLRATENKPKIATPAEIFKKNIDEVNANMKLFEGNMEKLQQHNAEMEKDGITPGEAELIKRNDISIAMFEKMIAKEEEAALKLEQHLQKAIQKTEEQTDQQAKQHDEVMKKGSAKHNQLRWTLAG